MPRSARWPLIGLVAFAMVQATTEKDSYYARLRSIESDLSEASRVLTSSESEVASLDASVGTLASRLATVRSRGYSALSHLDKTIEILTKKWAEVGPAVKQSLANNLQPLSSQIRALQSEAQTLRMEIDGGNLPAALSLSSRLGGDASSIKARATAAAAQATAPAKQLAAGLSAVDRDLKIAETTVTLFSQAGFPMKQEESPVLAIEGKLMEGEKCHGTLYFTNQRFLFEGQKEVVLEKKLFIVTKKRIDRSVMLERPVGAVQDITKGRVGLLAGAGVYVQFRPEVGVPTTPFDVRGWEADVITRFFKYITGGEADRDIATVRGVAPATTPSIRLVRCPSCGAPHSGEIYRGQTSVNCEYCGSTVAVT